MKAWTLVLAALLGLAAPSGAASSAEAWRDHGRRLLAAGRGADAERAFALAVRGRPEDPVAWAGLGNARWAQGRREAALEAWRRSLRLKPDNAGLARFVRSVDAAARPAAAPAPEPGRWRTRGLAGAFVTAGLVLVALF